MKISFSFLCSLAWAIRLSREPLLSIRKLFVSGTCLSCRICRQNSKNKLLNWSLCISGSSFILLRRRLPYVHSQQSITCNTTLTTGNTLTPLWTTSFFFFRTWNVSLYTFPNNWKVLLLSFYLNIIMDPLYIHSYPYFYYRYMKSGCICAHQNKPIANTLSSPTINHEWPLKCSALCF